LLYVVLHENELDLGDVAIHKTDTKLYFFTLQFHLKLVNVLRHLRLDLFHQGNQSPAVQVSVACRVRIFRAEKKYLGGGKVEFNTNEVVYVDLKHSTANVSYVQSFIQDLWGPQYFVVSNDGLPISDTAVTRGVWISCS